uniref:RNase H type-1 domain-containing protein n=1 Tax=Fagus sylvatica TaxID=28930 RepID=A0A2N9I0F7_FAGSY
MIYLFSLPYNSSSQSHFSLPHNSARRQLVLPQSASSAFLLVQVLVVALLHRLLQEVHGFGFGFCGGCLGFEDGFGFGFCGGWGGEGASGGGFVAAGCWGSWVLVMWVSGLMLGLDCGGFSGGSFDFVVFLVEGLILSAVVQFTSCYIEGSVADEDDQDANSDDEDGFGSSSIDDDDHADDSTALKLLIKVDRISHLKSSTEVEAAWVRMGIGVVVRDATGEVLASLCEPLAMGGNCMWRIAQAILRALQFCVDVGFHSFILECSNASFVSLLKDGPQCCTELAWVIQQIQDVKRSLGPISFLAIHKSCSTNSCGFC